MSACSCVGCERSVFASGLCGMHYSRMRKHGTTEPPPKAKMPLEDRFWRKVEKRGENDCWLWTGSKQPTGYGYIGGGKRNGVRWMAHRLSFVLAGGTIGDGEYVLHACDNPSCVNPKHLRSGSAWDNTKDAMERGRLKNPPVMTGERNHKSKLTIDAVKIIRAAKEVKSTVLASTFGVSVTTVNRIKRGDFWKI